MLNSTFQGHHFQWLDYANPTADELQALKETYGLHALAIEQCLSPHTQRPKLIHYENGYFFLDNYILYNRQTYEMEVREIGYFIGPHYFISLHRHPANAIQAVLQQAKNEPIETITIERLFYLILDEMLDQQFMVLDQVDRSIDELERNILAEKYQTVSATFFRIKKNLMKAKKSYAPRRDCIAKLIRYNDRILHKEHQAYYLDLYDHALRALDTVQTQLDTLNGVLEIYLTTLSNRTNETVKMLTLLATLAVPITVIATVYGMNFKSIPEFDWQYGYAFFWATTLMTTGGLYAYLKKRKWF